MSNLDRSRDRRSRRPLLHLRARSPEPVGQDCTGSERLETAALRALLLRRREGAFVTAEGMDNLLAGMIAERRSARGLPR